MGPNNFLSERKKKKGSDSRMAAGIMEVLLVSAKGLEDSDFLGDMDPYVIIQYKGQERKSSVARGDGSSPSWNEKFTFRVEYPGSGGDYKLILKIMDKDTFSSDFVGQATIYVKDLLAIGAEKGNAEIHPTKHSVVNAENSYRGDITVGVTFTTKVKENEEEEEEEYGGWRQSNF
ncbi:Calcium-dependent lipid-binding family protein isoform 2 [Hibiscus syriacus]|uniref:Calcium-dependent lipid-binding family protein isoform 2 n=1 Tax=Hibiscus syriacus TaxID=106335 RepID=A0A6A2XXZ4_HIBSY|nr:16 kDa phloem protein 1-like [Hibiscus syriacus]KAE8671965.1 Calcium-dependent lipid-binding family protein isoform 2 [Hibiscus syriacus]